MRSKRLTWMVIGIFSLAFLLFVVFYQRYTLTRVKHNIAEHVAVLAPFLWNYDENYVSYLTLAARTHTYAELTVEDRLGHESLSLKGPPPTRFDRWLMAVKFIPLYQFQEAIEFSGKKIGTLTVIWRCTTIYMYFYVAICLLLAATGTRLFVGLMFNKKQLEIRNRQLQQEIAERQRTERALQQAHEEMEQRVQERTAELANANEALRESEQQFRDIAKNIPGMVYQFRVRPDGSTYFSYVSPRGNELFGLSEDPASADWDLGGRVHPEDLEGFLASVGQAVAQCADWDYEGRMLLPDGSMKWFQGISSPTRIGDEMVFNGILVDITERKRAEAALQESEARFRAVYENSRDAIGVSKQGITVFANPAYIKLFGYDRQEDMVGRSILEHIAPRARPQIMENIQKRARGENVPIRYETIGLRKNGEEFYFEVVVATFIQQNEQYTLAILRDMTERKRMEEELQHHREHLEKLVAERTETLEQEIVERKRAEQALQDAKESALEAKERAEDAQRASEVAQRAAEDANRAKSIFLANMSHELRTPLNAILGFSNLMAREHDLTSSQRDNLAVINRSGEHLLTLINDILDMSKIEAGQSGLDVSSFDLDRSLSSIEEMLRLRAEQKGLKLIVERAPNLPRYIRADEGKLRQVLINLLSNAVKFTEKGSVTLCIKKLETRNLKLEKQDSTPTSRGSQFPVSSFQFQIKDTGIGIPPEELEHIFDPFVQTAGSQKVLEGTGLGLAISRQFVQLMGGELTATSQPGQGSVFTFTIQAETAETAQIEEQHTVGRVVGLAPEQHAPDGGPYRLLIAEDKEFNRLLLQRLLETLASSGQGFNVRTAINGQEALEITEEWHPHLIFMDMRMPVMNGYTATREIRKLDSRDWALGTGRSGLDAGSSVLGAENTGPQGRDSQPSEPRTENREPSTQHPVIIALTASAFEEDRKKVLAAGCDDFIRKPVKEEEIFSMLEKHLGVQFVYEAGRPSREDQRLKDTGERLKVEGAVLTSEALAALPTDLLMNLEQATNRSNMNQVAAIIEDIRPHDAVVADALARLADEFQYDEILRLIQETKSV